MKIFANRNIWKKIVIIFMLMFSVSFVEPKPVEAGIGGDLMKPICQFVVGIGDGFTGLLHKWVMGQEVSIIRIDKDKSWKIITAIATVILVAAAIVATCLLIATGVGAAIAALGITAISTTVSIGGIATVAIIGGIAAGAAVYNADWWDDSVILPMYSITPEAIFSNKVPLFNANFIDPPDDVAFTLDDTEKGQKQIAIGTEAQIDDKLSQLDIGINTCDEFMSGASRTQNTYVGGTDIIYTRKMNEKTYRLTTNGYVFTLYEVEVEAGGEKYALSYELQHVVSKWYNILRTVAIVGMMSVLVYIGIRILISSTSPQKAKYKEMLKDWLVGIVLLFTMHYIMAFLNFFVNQLTVLFDESMKVRFYNAIEYDGEVEKELKDNGIEFVEDESQAQDNNSKIYKYTSSDNKKMMVWTTDFMGKLRMEAAGNKDTNDVPIGSTIMFAVMVIYTFAFSWTYIKRVIYLAFLTLISPLVALTYPIDKVNDGQAQGFNTWFREYIFNLLLQPMHLLLFTILISSAAELARDSWVYALVALGFIGTAEKLFRKMFNFEKAHTPGVLAGPAGAALTITGMKSLLGHGPKGGSNQKGGGNSSDSSKDSGLQGGTAKTKIRDGLSGLLGNVEGANLVNSSAKNTTGVKSTLKRAFGNKSNKGVGAKVSTEGTGSSTNKNGISFGTRLGRNFKAFGAGTGAYTRGLGRKFKRSFKNGQPLKNLVRTAGGAAIGTAAGMIGLAAGVASGDANKAAQYATLGLTGGYKLGSNVVDSATNALSVEGTDDVVKRTAYGEDYDEIMAEKDAKEFAKRADVIDYMYNINTNLKSNKEAEDMAQDLAMKYGVKEGNYNLKDWKKFEKFQKQQAAGQDRNYTAEEAVGASKLYKVLNGQDDIDKALANQFPNLSSSERRRYKEIFADWSAIENEM